jgi:hypothetical protein
VKWRVNRKRSYQGITRIEIHRRVAGDDALGVYTMAKTIDQTYLANLRPEPDADAEWTDTSITSGKTYLYRLYAFNKLGSSGGTPFKKIAIP